jgi:hypothetical protein
MSISKFDDPLRLSQTPVVRVGYIRIDVGGPLTLDPGAQYTRPFAVHFEIIQSPVDPANPEERLHDPALARRASGVVTTDGTGGRWDGYVEVPPGFFTNGEARGVGVAVLPQEKETASGKGGYATETLTWCDHIELVVDAAQAA